MHEVEEEVGEVGASTIVLDRLDMRQPVFGVEVDDCIVCHVRGIPIGKIAISSSRIKLRVLLQLIIFNKNAMSNPKGFRLQEDDSPKPDGINHLLVIAIDEYQHAPKLMNCKRDAEALVKILTEKYRFDPEHVTTLYDQQATRGSILETLEAYRRKIKEGDTLLVYYSGHGEIDGNKGYWVPIEAQVNKRHQYVSNFDIKGELDEINAFHIFLVADACFSGSLFTSYKSISPGNENRKSRWGLSASHSREVALDGRQGENSPFAKQLLKYLRENDYDVGIHKMSASVMDDVRRESSGKQNPVFQPLDVAGHDLGQFVFQLRNQNTFVDHRDGKVYRTVQINGLTWMADNLDYEVTKGSWYYLDDSNIGMSFGRLYTWESAIEACPEGWRIPSEEEWRDLEAIFLDPEEVYNYLIKGGESGFYALLGGYRHTNGIYQDLGSMGHYWSATEKGTSHACRYLFHSDRGKLLSYDVKKDFGFSCKCVMTEF